MLRDEELLSSIESEQMMYAFNDLIEEFKACRKFLTELILSVSESEFFWIPENLDESCVSIAQQLGHIALTEKEVGKKAEINFSFRLDLFDDLFSETNAPLNKKELPSKEEIINYVQEVHECFLSEIRYHKKSDLLFALVNHNYKHIHEICNLLHLMGRLDLNLRPKSERITSHKTKIPHFKLPVYSN